MFQRRCVHIYPSPPPTVRCLLLLVMVLPPLPLLFPLFVLLLLPLPSLFVGSLLHLCTPVLARGTAVNLQTVR